MKKSVQSKGGEARAASMTSEERSEVASKAARARWKTKRGVFSRIELSEDGERFVEIRGPGSLTKAEMERIGRWLETLFIVRDSTPKYELTPNPRTGLP